MSHRISAASIVIVPCQQYPSESSYMPTLQIIISPAKTMRCAGAQSPADDVLPLHVPPFPVASAYLVSYLQSCSRDKLQTLWHTSDKLTDACYEITRELEVPQTYNQARSSHFSTRVTPALFTYDGLQFHSMAPEVLDQDSLTWLDEHLWILSGLYGCVRPYDAVMPYRLEMAAHINLDAPAGHLKSLYDFWETVLRTPLAIHTASLILQVLNMRVPFFLTLAARQSHAYLPNQSKTINRSNEQPRAKLLAAHLCVGWLNTRLTIPNSSVILTLGIALMSATLPHRLSSLFASSARYVVLALTLRLACRTQGYRR